MAKVRCSVCNNEDKGFCKVKKLKVKVNKPRTCEFFDFNEAKVKIKKQLKSTYIPFHIANRDERRRYLSEQEMKQAVESQTSILKNPDCLAQFRSSAGVD